MTYQGNADPPDHSAVARALAVLRDGEHAIPAGSFPAEGLDVDQPGLYAWWVDPDGRAILSGVFETRLPALVYAGQAGATSTRTRAEHTATLGSRIIGNHLRGNVRSSTFRKSLTAALCTPLGLVLEGPGKLSPASNAAISEWMNRHLSVVTFPWPDRDELAPLEQQVLRDLDPPLNLAGCLPTATRRRLKALRGSLSNGRGYVASPEPRARRPRNDGPTRGFVGEPRHCELCDADMTGEEPDACLGLLPGVQAACCGHGELQGYLLFSNGVRVGLGPHSTIESTCPNGTRLTVRTPSC